MSDVSCQPLQVGWANADITPSEPVLLGGQFYARLSEGVHDPLTATVLVLATGVDQVVMVSCDLVAITDQILEAVRARLPGRATGLDPQKVVLNATHTHTAPLIRFDEAFGASGGDVGVDLPAMPIPAYITLVAERVAEAVQAAWAARAPGRVAFGLGHAVLGRNRRMVYDDGRSVMYGPTNVPDFAHIEGYEDHSVNLLATYDLAGQLTGLVLNVPCPSQVSEHEFWVSADYWHEARLALRQAYGAGLQILPQCSAAGELVPRPQYERQAHSRMERLAGRNTRQELAQRLTVAVRVILPLIAPTASGQMPLRHRVVTLALAANALSAADADKALRDAEPHQKEYARLLAQVQADPTLRQRPRWYKDLTMHYRRAKWYEGVAQRYQQQLQDPTIPSEIHVIRLGDLALATNAFEFYLDLGVIIKARSPATQTFIVQLAGPGTYAPSPRSVQGGGYGAVPSSNRIGPPGTRQLAEATLTILHELWAKT